MLKLCSIHKTWTFKQGMNLNITSGTRSSCWIWLEQPYAPEQLCEPDEYSLQTIAPWPMAFVWACVQGSMPWNACNLCNWCHGLPTTLGHLIIKLESPCLIYTHVYGHFLSTLYCNWRKLCGNWRSKLDKFSQHIEPWAYFPAAPAVPPFNKLKYLKVRDI